MVIKHLKEEIKSVLEWVQQNGGLGSSKHLSFHRNTETQLETIWNHCQMSEKTSKIQSNQSNTKHKNSGKASLYFYLPFLQHPLTW